jgi:hypothetical protein
MRCINHIQLALLAVMSFLLLTIPSNEALAAEAKKPAVSPAAAESSTKPAQPSKKAPPATELTPEQKAELEAIMECDRKLCDMALHLNKAKNNSLKCDLSKTWLKAQIAEAWVKTKVAWPFGDASCSAKFDLPRKLLTGALTNKKYTLKVSPHTIACEVKNGEKSYPMKAKVTPSIDFRDGKATYVKLGVGKIEGNAVIKGAVWTAAKMVSAFGIFQDDFRNGVNDYIGKYCVETYGKDGDTSRQN